jgi:4-amino-4-deoxychorismate lyase
MSSEGALRDLARPGFGLIETLRWEPASGFLRLDRHLGRMARSAACLGLGFSRDAALQKLAGVAAGAPLRGRLLLSPDASFEVTTAPFVAVAEGAAWRLQIARTRLSSANPLLRHKTTRRSVYEAARAEFSSREADEVLLCNEAGMLCEGAITNIFLRNGAGPLRTPALQCGLLPGVLRQELIDGGDAVEAVLSPDDLVRADEVFVGNALRGLVPARIER